MVLFADHTNIFCTGEDLQHFNEIVRSKHLIIKLNKSKIMVFGNSRLTTKVNIQINNVYIERVNERRFIGLVIDD